MKIARQIVVFDAADLTTESSFWANVLAATVEAAAVAGFNSLPTP